MALTTTRALFKRLVNRENPTTKPFPSAFLDRMFDDLDWGAKRALLRLYRATPASLAGSNDLAEALGALRLPALVIWGAADKSVPARYAARQREVFAAAQVHVLEDCGHWPFIDEPARVAELLVDFLQRRLEGHRMAPAYRRRGA